MITKTKGKKKLLKGNRKVFFMKTKAENKILREAREKDLEKFEKGIKELSTVYEVETLGEFSYIIHKKKKSERARLTIMGLTHGNEVSGFWILFEFISYLKKIKPHLPFSIGVALGNTEAFKEGERFLECDLNRSFASKEPKLKEQKRAGILSKLLLRTDFLVDFHQTQRPTLKPFFIFPYTKNGFNLAANLSEEIPIVTHWGGGFSKDGMCTDEYLNSKGGTGISIETGYCGRDPLQISFGLKLIFEAVFLKTFLRKEKTLSFPENLSPNELSIYTWSFVYPYPETELVSLIEGLINFSFIEKGKELGLCGTSILRAEEEGYLMFPKYIKSSQPKPKELFRLLKKISYKDLPS